MSAYIYKIVSPNGQIYIGSTTMSIAKRFTRHRSRARCDNDRKSKLYACMREIGPNLFTIELMHEVPAATRLQAEAECIRSLNSHVSGLNSQVPGGRTQAERREQTLMRRRLLRAPPQPEAMQA